MATASPTTTWKSVAIPKEHGGWALIIEAVFLGMLVAPSIPGIAVGIAGIAGFLLRTSACTVAVDLQHNRRLPRTRIACNAAILELSVLVLCGAIIAPSVHLVSLISLVVCAPFLASAFWSDTQHHRRHALPEMLYALCTGVLATLAANVGGASPQQALVLWMIFAIRALLAIQYVRVQLARTKQRKNEIALLASAYLVSAVVLIFSMFWGLHFAIPCTFATIAIAQLLTFLRPSPPAITLGIVQTLSGLSVIAITTWTFRNI